MLLRDSNWRYCGQLIISLLRLTFHALSDMTLTANNYMLVEPGNIIILQKYLNI
jgi:hypothetical protein